MKRSDSFRYWKILYEEYIIHDESFIFIIKFIDLDNKFTYRFQPFLWFHTEKDQ